MADIKISALPGASTLTGAETIPLVQGGTTKKVTTDQFLTKDASGNVGLGVTPSAWGGGGNLQLVDGGMVSASSGYSSYGANFYYGSGAYRYISVASTPATMVHHNNGAINWQIAPAGTAGNPISFTQAMTLGANSNLTTTAAAGLDTKFVVATNGVQSTMLGFNNSGSTNIYGVPNNNSYVGNGNAYGLKFVANGTTQMGVDALGAISPNVDNTQNCGTAPRRWATVYAGTGTINTSDAREKTDVRVMAADEIEAAKALSKEIGIYQFLDSVEKKGDEARHHVGLTVQRAIELMKLHGLDPFAYGFICFDKWDDVVVEHPAVEAKAATEAKDAVVDDEGNVIEAAVEAQDAIEAKDAWTEVTLKAGDRYSFRYDQLNLFIARGIEARLAALEAK